MNWTPPAAALGAAALLVAAGILVRLVWVALRKPKRPRDDNQIAVHGEAIGDWPHQPRKLTQADVDRLWDDQIGTRSL